MVCPALGTAMAALLLVAQTPPTNRASGRKACIDSALLSRYARVDLSLYRMEVRPSTPDTGITTGLVIVYGHPLTAPYGIEVLDTALLINGVQVNPPLQTEAMHRAVDARWAPLRDVTPAVRERRDSIETLLHSVWRTFDSVARAHSVPAGRRAAFATLDSSPLVDSVWEGPQGVEVRFSTHDAPVALSLCELTQPGSQRGDSSRALRITPRALLESKAAIVRQGLARGRTVIIGGTSDGWTRRSAAIAALAILSDQAMVPAAKMAALAKHFGQPEWLVANFCESEWASVAPYLGEGR